jgi:predicted Holliday junction resolvase-like endonuclease
MLRPAIFSTDEPPIEITDIPLKEYINSLRRRIEVQACQMDTLAQQVDEARKVKNAMTELFYQNVRKLQADMHNLNNPQK